MRRSRDDFTFVVGIVALLAIAAFASQARSQQLEPMTPVRKLTPAEMNHMVGNNIPPGYMVSNGHLIPYGSGQPAVGGSSGTLGAVVPVTKTVMTSGWQSSFGSRSASSGSCGTPSVPQSRPTPLSRPSGSGVPFFSRFRGNPDFPVKKSASTGDCASGQCDANTPPRPSRPALDSGSGSKDSGSRVSGGGGSFGGGGISHPRRPKRMTTVVLTILRLWEEAMIGRTMSRRHALQQMRMNTT